MSDILIGLLIGLFLLAMWILFDWWWNEFTEFLDKDNK